jgi:hypothetical protein
MINDKIKAEYVKNGHGVSPSDLTAEQFNKIGHEKISPMKVIRLKCLDCCCGSPVEVKACVMLDCPLWPFRMGKNIWRTPISDERREALSIRAKALFSKENSPETI